MKKLLLASLVLVTIPTFASDIKGLYWYAENKTIIEGDRKEGMVINNDTVDIIDASYKSILTCQIDKKTTSILIFTCTTPKISKTFEYNIVEDGNYIFTDNDPDNGGYIKD